MSNIAFQRTKIKPSAKKIVPSAATGAKQKPNKKRIHSQHVIIEDVDEEDDDEEEEEGAEGQSVSLENDDQGEEDADELEELQRIEEEEMKEGFVVDDDEESSDGEGDEDEEEEEGYNSHRVLDNQLEQKDYKKIKEDYKQRKKRGSISLMDDSGDDTTALEKSVKRLRVSKKSESSVTTATSKTSGGVSGVPKPPSSGYESTASVGSVATVASSVSSVPTVRLDLGNAIDCFMTLESRLVSIATDQVRRGVMYDEKEVDDLLRQIEDYWCVEGSSDYSKLTTLVLTKMGTPYEDQDEELGSIQMASKTAQEMVNFITAILMRNKMFTEEDQHRIYRQRIKALKAVVEIVYRTRYCVWQLKHCKPLVGPAVKNGANAEQLAVPVDTLFGSGAFGSAAGTMVGEELSDPTLLPKPKTLLPSQILMYYLRDQCYSWGYRKMGQDIYAQVTHKVSVQQPPQPQQGYDAKAAGADVVVAPETKELNVKAYKYLCTAKEFLFRVTDSKINPVMERYRTSLGSYDQVLKDFEHNRDHRCKVLLRERQCWSFSNGFYDGKNDVLTPHVATDEIETEEYKQAINDRCAIKFIPYPLLDMQPVGPNLYTKGDGKYFNGEGKFVYQKLKGGRIVDSNFHVIYDSKKALSDTNKPPLRCVRDIATPQFEKMLDLQDFPLEARDWLYVMIGRMFFELGLDRGGDNWQVCPMLFGKAGTGKSTIARYIMNCYEPTDIFILESNGESTFQLENAIGKLMWCILELKKDIRLSSARYQTMVSGEEMEIPRKHQSAYKDTWRLPGMMVGNDTIPYSDAQGSISRRTLSWEFNKKIQSTDTHIGLKMEQERPNFIRKCIQSYLIKRKEIGEKGFWNVAPQYFKQTQENLKKNVDPIANFIYKFCQPVSSSKAQGKSANFPSQVIPLDVFCEAVRKANPRDTSELSEVRIISTLESMPDIKLFQLAPHLEDANKFRELNAGGDEDEDDLMSEPDNDDNDKDDEPMLESKEQEDKEEKELKETQDELDEKDEKEDVMAEDNDDFMKPYDNYDNQDAGHGVNLRGSGKIANSKHSSTQQQGPTNQFPNIAIDPHGIRSIKYSGLKYHSGVFIQLWWKPTAEHVTTCKVTRKKDYDGASDDEEAVVHHQNRRSSVVDHGSSSSSFRPIEKLRV